MGLLDIMGTKSKVYITWHFLFWPIFTLKKVETFFVLSEVEA